MMISIKGKRSCSGSLKWRTMILIWAKLGLLEVLRLLVRMPGEGDVTALPLFHRGAEEARDSGGAVCCRVGQGECAGELGFLSLLSSRASWLNYIHTLPSGVVS
jgi:hypothetical protein